MCSICSSDLQRQGHKQAGYRGQSVEGLRQRYFNANGFAHLAIRSSYSLGSSIRGLTKADGFFIKTRTQQTHGTWATSDERRYDIPPKLYACTGDGPCVCLLFLPCRSDFIEFKTYNTKSFHWNKRKKHQTLKERIFVDVVVFHLDIELFKRVWAGSLT